MDDNLLNVQNLSGALITGNAASFTTDSSFTNTTNYTAAAGAGLSSNLPQMLGERGRGRWLAASLHRNLQILYFVFIVERRV